MNETKKPTISLAAWKEEIDASRRRRDQHKDTWGNYARLHTNAYRAVQGANEDKNVTLPNGDQIKVALVYRNIEQTMALLEVPELGIRVKANDYTHELGREDSHRESVIEEGILNSMNNSGLVSGEEEADDIKRDGIIIGHSIDYTYYNMIEEEVEVDRIPMMMETEAGAFLPVIDEATGQPRFETETEKQITYQAVKDERISPLEFLFSASARKIRRSAWHGYERIESLKTLKQDPRFNIPDTIEGTTYRETDLYGDNTDDERQVRRDSVKVVVIWDKLNKELIHFIEYTPCAEASGKNKNKHEDRALIPVRVDKWPVRFKLPDDSPFSFFIPIPANDHPFGISQVEHIRNPALEADKLRTRMANLTRQLKLVWLYRKGKIDQDQLSQAMKSPEAMPVGVDLQEDEDFSKFFKELKPNQIPKELYEQMGRNEDDVRKIEGISETPFGGAETATESENQMAIGGARPNRKRRLYLSFLTEVAKRHKDFLAQFAPDGQTMVVAGADGKELTLEYGRAAFQGSFDIYVLAGGGATNVSPVKQKTMMEMSGMVLGRYGPKFDSILLRQMLTMFDLRDTNALAQAAMEFAQLVPPEAGPAGSGPPRPELNLNDISNGQAIRAAINPNE